MSFRLLLNIFLTTPCCYYFLHPLFSDLLFIFSINFAFFHYLLFMAHFRVAADGKDKDSRRRRTRCLKAHSFTPDPPLSDVVYRIRHHHASVTIGYQCQSQDNTPMPSFFSFHVQNTTSNTSTMHSNNPNKNTFFMSIQY